MTAAHTPGPWVLEHYDFEGHYEVGTVDPHGDTEVIAQVFYANDGPGGRGKADARLIAAAPALLEALEAIAARKWDSMTQGCDAAAEAKNIAIAAISLARGESA